VPETTLTEVPAETSAAVAPVIPPPVQQEPPRTAAPVDTVRQVAPQQADPPPEPPAQATPIDPERQRYAKTWANVRAERNSSATVLQVLDRGEIVAIDSLQDGWYRVTTDRPVVGYVDQQYLDTVPPGPP
jgi:uncharacterized protein YgiM (DUF1202 family)